VSELQGLQSKIESIRKLDAEVLAVSADASADLLGLARAQGLSFPLLSDPRLEAIDAYGLRHAGGGLEGDIARPAVFIVDREGRIAWRDLTDDWRVRVRPERVLELLRTLP
jgi:peroxiredoxin